MSKDIDIQYTLNVKSVNIIILQMCNIKWEVRVEYLP